MTADKSKAPAPHRAGFFFSGHPPICCRHRNCLKNAPLSRISDSMRLWKGSFVHEVGAHGGMAPPENMTSA